jgi:hypothetical protein
LQRVKWRKRTVACQKGIVEKCAKRGGCLIKLLYVSFITASPAYWQNNIFCTILGGSTVPGLLDNKGRRRCRLLLNKKWHLLTLFLSNEPGTGVILCYPESKCLKNTSCGQCGVSIHYGCLNS